MNATELQLEVVDALRADFTTRLKRNPRFSLRTYARSLDIDQSLLSKILMGKRRPSQRIAIQVAERIGLKPAPLKSKKSEAYQKLSEDMFSILSEWYHFALLELIRVESKKVSATRLAERLGLHLFETDLALKRLERVGFLAIQTDGSFKVLAPDTSWYTTSRTTPARKKLQKQMLEMALLAIDEVDFDLRESSSLTIACNPKHLPEIRERMRNFRRELDQFIEDKKDATEVYQLSLVFYPVSRKGKNP